MTLFNKLRARIRHFETSVTPKKMKSWCLEGILKENILIKQSRSKELRYNDAKHDLNRTEETKHIIIS